MATKHENFTYAEVFGEDADREDRQRRSEKNAAEGPVLSQRRNEWIKAIAVGIAANFGVEYRRKEYLLAQELSRWGRITQAADQFMIAGNREFPCHIDNRRWSGEEMNLFVSATNEALHAAELPIKIKIWQSPEYTAKQEYYPVPVRAVSMP